MVVFASFFRREQFSHFHDGRKEVADENVLWLAYTGADQL